MKHGLTKLLFVLVSCNTELQPSSHDRKTTPVAATSTKRLQRPNRDPCVAVTEPEMRSIAPTSLTPQRLALRWPPMLIGCRARPIGCASRIWYGGVPCQSMSRRRIHEW